MWIADTAKPAEPEPPGTCAVCKWGKLGSRLCDLRQIT